MRLGYVASQWVTVLVLLAIVAGLAWWRPEWLWPEITSRPASTSSGGGSYHAIDGDSFSLGQTEIRLHGIDAPEYRQTCRDEGGTMQPCGKLARDALSKLIRKGEVSCRVMDRDRYGRQVSVCTTGKTDINREMVAQGWAFAYRKHSLAYAAAEREAKEAQRGMWRWSVERPEDYRNRSRSFEGSLGGGFKDE